MATNSRLWAQAGVAGAYYLEDDNTKSVAPWTDAVSVSPPGAPGGEILFRTATPRIYQSDTPSLPLLATLPALPSPPGPIQSDSGWVDGSGNIWVSAGSPSSGYAIYRWSGGPSWTRHPALGAIPASIGASGWPLTLSDGPASSILWAWGVGTATSFGVTRYIPTTGVRTVLWNPLTSPGGPLTLGTCHFVRWVGTYGLVGYTGPNQPNASFGIYKFDSSGNTISGPHRFGFAVGHYVQQIQRDQTGQFWALIIRTPSSGYVNNVVRFDPATMAVTAGPFTYGLSTAGQVGKIYGGPILAPVAPPGPAGHWVVGRISI